MARKMQHTDRVQDQNALLVRNKLQTRATLCVAPTDPAVPRLAATPARVQPKMRPHRFRTRCPMLSPTGENKPRSRNRTRTACSGTRSETLRDLDRNRLRRRRRSRKRRRNRALNPRPKRSRDPVRAMQEAGSDPPPRASDARNAPQCRSSDPNRRANPSARKAQPIPASGSNGVRGQQATHLHQLRLANLPS